jgi:hypothetical protein
MAQTASEFKIQEGTPRIVKSKEIVAEKIEATRNIIGKISWS